MLPRPGARAEESFFLAAPEGDANRAARLHADGFENSHHLEHHRRAVGVVGGAKRGVPRIDVRAGHHDLIAQPRIGPGISAMML